MSKAEAKVGWMNQPAEEEKDYSSCDLEVMSQSLILPPTDRPYFLLLQGYDQSKVRYADRSPPDPDKYLQMTPIHTNYELM